MVFYFYFLQKIDIFIFIEQISNILYINFNNDNFHDAKTNIDPFMLQFFYNHCFILSPSLWRKICFILLKGQLLPHYVSSTSYHCEKRCCDVNKIFNLPLAFNFKHRCRRCKPKKNAFTDIIAFAIKYVAIKVMDLDLIRLFCNSANFK